MAPPFQGSSTISGQAGNSGNALKQPRNPSSDGHPPANGPLTESGIDLTAYPILTEEVSFPTPAPRSYGPGAAGTGSLSQTVESALRDVLGWRPKTNDPKGFTAALTQSFSLKRVEGHVEANWMPRNYAVAVQADLGAITGAQASIYARAKVALDESLPLLDSLTSLRTDILPEDQEATRSIVRSEFIQLVNELGMEGGPRVQRVDELFGYLLGTPASPSLLVAGPYPITADQLVYAQEELYYNGTPPSSLTAPPGWPPSWWSLLAFPGSHLGVLGLRFGMERGRVNTIDDEQDLTNFVILVDYVAGLWQTWINQRPYFSRLPSTVTPPYQPYFGTQLVLVSRALAVVAEAVDEVNFTMDSVFLGPAERQTLQLNFSGSFPMLYYAFVPSQTQAQAQGVTQVGQPFTYTFPAQTSPMFIAELLDWINRVASEEGPRLIQDAGKDGTVALSQTLDNLRTFARGALMKPLGVQTQLGMPRGYSTPRVQRAIRELADSLDEALNTAYQIQGLQIPNI
jgi:hypothetical protein